MPMLCYEHPEPLVDPSAHVTLFAKDYRTMLPLLPPVDVVLTDPPYMWYVGLCAMDARNDIADQPIEGVWPVYAWFWAWYPLLLARVRRALWFTTDRRYLRFYQGMTTPNLTMTVWPLTEEARLVHIGPTPLPCPPAEVLAQYRYGSDSPVGFWAGLLAATPGAGGLLLDPFCGTGSALEAGLAAGYRVVGIEHEPRTFRRLQRRVQRIKARQTAREGVSSGPSGPGQET